jgi:uncharacterized membrane protein
MPQDWDNFSVIAGGASGALTGLLFVAVSLNRERIARHAGLRSQAGQTLVLFSLPLLLALLLTLPGLSPTAIGAGLIVLAVVAGATLILIGQGKAPTGDAAEDRLARLVDRVSPNLAVLVFVLIAGSLQLAGDDGLYWAAASSAICLIGGVTNAWLFLTRS